MLHYTINKFGCRLPLFYNSPEKKEEYVCEKVFPKYKVISRDKIMPRSVLFCTLSLLLSGCSQLLDIVAEVIKLHADISDEDMNHHSCAPCRSPRQTEMNGHFRIVNHFVLKQISKINWISYYIFLHLTTKTVSGS